MTTSKPTKIAAIPIGGRKSKQKRDPASLTNLAPYFHVKAELEDDDTFYDYCPSAGSEKAVQIHHFPGELLTSLERIQMRVERSKPPSLNTIIACCLSNGAEVIADHPHAKALLKLRERHYLLDSESESTSYEVTSTFFRSVDLQLDFSGRRRNPTVPQLIYTAISELASGLGIPMNKIAVIALMITLKEQPEVLTAQRKQMAGTIEQFFDRVRMKADAAKAFMTAIRKSSRSV